VAKEKATVPVGTARLKIDGNIVMTWSYPTKGCKVGGYGAIDIFCPDTATRIFVLANFMAK
jgi:hypothetical protein